MFRYELLYLIKRIDATPVDCSTVIIENISNIPSIAINSLLTRY
jgi:hypothetical protein